MDGNIPSFNDYIGKKRNSPPTFEEFKQTYEPPKPDIPKLNVESPKPPKPESDGSILGWIGDVGKDLGEGIATNAKAQGLAAKALFDNDYSFKEAKKDQANLIDDYQKNTSSAMKDLQVLSNSFSDSATLGLLGMDDETLKKDYGIDTSNRRGWKIAGQVIGSLAPGLGAVKAARGIGLGAKSLKGLSTFQKARTIGKEGAAAGAIFGVANEGMQEVLDPEKQNFKQHLTDIGLDTAAGAVLDPLVHVAGSKLLGRFFKKGKVSKSELDNALKDPNTPNEVKQEILALPEPQQRLPEPQTVKGLKFQNKEVNIQGTPLLNPGKTQKFIQAKPTSNYYKEKFNELIDLANNTPLPPGRELEAAQGLWSQIAGPKDPNLNKLIDLANKDPMRGRSKLDLIKQARQSQRNSVYGLDNILNKAQYKEKPVTVNEGKPLTFKREQFNPIVDKGPLNYVGKMKPFNTTKAIYNKPKIDDALLNSLEYGDKVTLRQGRGEKEMTFVKRNGNQVVLKKPSGKDVVVPAELVSGKTPDITPKTPDVAQNLKQSLNPEKPVNPVEGNKDISPIQRLTHSIYQIAERLPKAMGSRIKSTLDSAKEKNINFQQKATDDLYDKVVKGLGIKNGSKESKLVQDFGEKTLAQKYIDKKGLNPATVTDEELNEINLAELNRLAPDKWQDIVKADKYFRARYDRLIELVNNVRAKIYPNNPEKLVPKRQDYYHHFNDLTGFESAKNLFDTPANIDPALEGISPYTKPKTKFQGFMQRRGIGPYKSDAIGGYLKYLKAASHSINIDPVIPVLRKIGDELAEQTTDSRNMNNIIATIKNLADDIAGKTNPVDRIPQDYILGRKGMRVLNWLNSRVKSNMILGNLSSTLGQLGNIPLGIAKAKQYSVPGLKKTLSQTAKTLIKGETDAPIHQSQFLKERFGDKMYRRFDQKLLDQPKKLAVWLLETADKSGTYFIWNSMYEKGIKLGVKNPIKYADYETRNLVAGRGVGEVPLGQKSKTFQIFAPFTLEVGNQWRVLKNMVGERDAAGILTFLMAAYGLNKVVEQVRGSNVAFDPLDAIIEGYAKTDGSVLDKTGGAVGSLTGEVIGNIPGGNLLTGGILADREIPFTNTKFNELFVDRNPNRFGTGLTFAKPIESPSYALLPFGASQINKTKEGFEAIQKEGYYKDGKLRTPINTGPLKNAQLLTFGQYSPSEVQDYFDQEKRPLSKNQTNIYDGLKKFDLEDDFFKKLSKLRENDKSPLSLQNKLKKVLNSNVMEPYKTNRLERILKSN